MEIYLIKSIQVVNEGTISIMDVLIKNGKIERLDPTIDPGEGLNVEIIDGTGRFLFPGVIDDQVHFREPGLTHKATIATESKAAVAGGVTSFMEMPNTVPPAYTLELLEEKYAIASRSSLANYSFYIGTSNENAEQALMANKHKSDICGIKIFMGSSTGNLLVDNPLTLEKVFGESELLIATHCEDERIIRQNLAALRTSGRELTAADHPVIRNEEACFESSFYAVQLAKKYDTRLHILHISTEKELQLFGNMFPLKEKRITAEVCVHHLHFTSNDYETLGNKIKCNPAIKAPHHKEALWKGLLDDRLDVIATDHAPHTVEEKSGGYEKAHAGVPLVQHSLLLMLEYYREGMISLPKIAEKMCHAVADCFQVKDRGYIREGYMADLVIVDLEGGSLVTKDSIQYKCGWSPFEGKKFGSAITHTFVSGRLVFEQKTEDIRQNIWNPVWNESVMGERLKFDR
ncbi:MAG: dihydroorotase [Chitinophagaceae bacterium]